MIESLYGLLSQLGFRHPLHPAITHLPMGMVMGAFFFSLGSRKFTELATTAKHCSILALIFVLPTIIAGMLDWQYFYAGDFSGLFIVKFVLATVFILLLIVTIKVAIKEPKDSSVSTLLTVLYGLCLLTAIGLGFTGGEIQYG